MLKSRTHVALSQDVTSIALPSLHESHSSLLPLPTTQGTTLVLRAEAVGARSCSVVPTITREVSKAVAPTTLKAIAARIAKEFLRVG
jgi:hypothetical protein